MTGKRGRPIEAYQGLSEAARAWIAERQAYLAILCGVSPTSVCDWASGQRRPSYAHVRVLLSRCGDHFTLEDFGYHERADGRVCRLLADGHDPAPECFVRASGDAACAHCFQTYRRHQIVSPAGSPDLFLHQLCDGRRVKL